MRELYKVTTFYGDEWGGRTHVRVDVLQMIHAVRRRVATANGNARYKYDRGHKNALTDCIVLVERLTDTGWEPVDDLHVIS